MKRMLSIIPVFVLSLLIIAMSAGVSVEVCSHVGRIEVAQIAEVQGSHDCHTMRHCMVVKTVKLAPVTMAEQLTFHFAPTIVALVSVAPLSALAHFFTPINAPSEYVFAAKAPPRTYLHLLRRLQL